MRRGIRQVIFAIAILLNGNDVVNEVDGNEEDSDNAANILLKEERRSKKGSGFGMKNKCKIR